MERTKEQWANCVAIDMSKMSEAAIMFAFIDAKKDIAELHATIERQAQEIAQAREQGRQEGLAMFDIKFKDCSFYGSGNETPITYIMRHGMFGMKINLEGWLLLSPGKMALHPEEMAVLRRRDPVLVDKKSVPYFAPMGALQPVAERVQPVAVPKGWKLVPIQPTAAMCDAGAEVDPERESVWAAYLAACPSAPSQPAIQAHDPKYGRLTGDNIAQPAQKKGSAA